MTLLLKLLVLFLLPRAIADLDNRVPVIGVSIEDFIDVDGPHALDKPQFLDGPHLLDRPHEGHRLVAMKPKEGIVLASSSGRKGLGANQSPSGDYGALKTGSNFGSAVRPPPPIVLTGDVIKPFLSMPDDEDAEVSGDGSGSGDDDAKGVTLELEVSRNTSDPSTTLVVQESRDKESYSTNSTLEWTTGENPHNKSVGYSVTNKVTDSFAINMMKSDAPHTSAFNVSQSVVTYSSTVNERNPNANNSSAEMWLPRPVTEQTKDNQDIERWSPWIRMDDATEVRIHTCSTSRDRCNSSHAEIRTCDKQIQYCNVTAALLASEEDILRGKCHPENTSSIVVPSGKPAIRPQEPGEIDLQQASLAPCSYSLFDLNNGKYVFADWSLAELVTQAKLRKWCSRPHEYLVLHSPYEHCRRYYKDLCHVTQRCKGSGGKPRSRGDFAEECWQEFVYDQQLPVGLSNRQTIVYLICQRFSSASSLGKAFGHKQPYFATIYDIKGRGPVVSLAHLKEMGDTSWPDTPYFIEHSLVEEDADTAWFLRRAQRGLLSLQDLGHCPSEHSCQLAAHQVLPSDYSSSTHRTAHLLWPELTGPDPLARLATFTLTNTAPMHQDLYPAWRHAIMQVRHFALEQCGLPFIPPSEFVSVPHAHKQNKHHHQGKKGSELYIASGIIPSRDPMETIGTDVNVPFMFWLAVCCVSQDSILHGRTNNSNVVMETNNTPSEGGHKTGDTNKKEKYLSFALYARNIGSRDQGSVVVAPVMQLEMLLQDIYKTLPTDANVNLFPGNAGTCSELRHDASRTITV